MREYFLIARNRKDNNFTILKLEESWYLGKGIAHDGIYTRDNNLEAIDLVTTKFSSEKEMAERMLSHGFISDSDVDIFIASKQEKDGCYCIKFDEVIYNSGNPEIIAALRHIAKASLVSNTDMDMSNLNAIYDRMIEKAYLDSDYLHLLLNGSTNVPLDFAEQLKCIPYNYDVPYNLKTSEGFEKFDYSVVRSIVESFNRVNMLRKLSHNSILKSNDSFIKNNQEAREVIIPELSVQIDSDYIEGQISLFSLFNDLKSTKSVVEEEKIIPAKIHIPRSGVSDSEKRKVIYSVLRDLPKHVFYKDKDNDTFLINRSFFVNYPLSEDEGRKLDTYLTGKLASYFYNYVRDYKNLCSAKNDELTSYYEIEDLESYVESDKKRIENRFKSSKCLNMAYEWCVLLDGAIKRDMAVGAGAKVVDFEDKVKTYGKKQDISD